MSIQAPYKLFEVFGIELEYMLVSKATLNITPIVDEVLKEASGEYTTDFVDDNIGWANELALHVMEVRNENPVKSLDSTPKAFSASLKKINAIAEGMGSQLMPSAMHPWMNPPLDTKLWPHEYHEIYNQFDRIFNCKRHGWANLQSCQLNLPFSGDEEFGQLHAAIRFLLPILPALASSSPIAEGKNTDFMNYRLRVYKDNATKTPLVAGQCIPEPIYSKKAYEDKLLQKIYDQIKPFDPHGALQHEWLNARGAIARFDRNAIEIRVLDMQEHPGVDIAICKVIAEVLKALVEERFGALDELKVWSGTSLLGILDQNILLADEAIIEDTNYLNFWGVREKRIRSRELWDYLIHDKILKALEQDLPSLKILQALLKEGVLSRRILKALGGNLSHNHLLEVYRELCLCLVEGRMFYV